MNCPYCDSWIKPGKLEDVCPDCHKTALDENSQLRRENERLKDKIAQFIDGENKSGWKRKKEKP